MEKVIGYMSDGTKVFEPKGLGCACILQCQECGAILATSCGSRDVYCPQCAAKKGLVKEEKSLKRMNS